MKWQCWYLVSLALSIPASASSGDRAPLFTDCLQLCTSRECDSTIKDPIRLPLSLRLAKWTCEDNCKYNCMHTVTTREIASGQRVQQYYGKWPFWRLGGIQEPASVLFSLMNLWFHLRGAVKFRREIPDQHPMKRYYLVWSFTSVNAWVWSTVFHTRDTPRTEKLDYFSAALTILCALYFTVIRLFHLYPTTRTRLTLSTSSSAPNILTKLWTILCVGAYICHVSYLTLLPRFDYSYNIIFNLIVGMTHNILWLLYALPASFSIFRRFPGQPKSYRPPFAGSAAILVAVTTLATLFEVFDFPPLARVIDAHSLWHLSTVPIAVYWYRFLVDDARDPSWREQKA